MRIFSVLLLVIIISFGVSFTLLNSQSTTIKYYFGEFSMPLSLILVFVLVLGIFIGLTCNFFSLIKLKLENRGLRKKLALNDEEISKLRLLNIESKD